MGYRKGLGGLFGREGTLLDRIVERAKNMGFFRFLAVTTVAAELFTLAMNTINSYLWWGTLSTDLLLIGVVDAFVVSVIVASAIIFVLFRLRESEEKTDQSARYLDSILRSSTGMAIAATDAQFRVTLINPAAEEMFGLSSGDVIGKDVRELHVDKQVDMEHFARAFESLNSPAGTHST